MLTVKLNTDIVKTHPSLFFHLMTRTWGSFGDLIFRLCDLQVVCIRFSLPYANAVFLIDHFRIQQVAELMQSQEGFLQEMLSEGLKTSVGYLGTFAGYRKTWS